MEANESFENIILLKEISNLKAKISELYDYKGPACSDYISLSIKLNALVKEYIEEKIVKLNLD